MKLDPTRTMENRFARLEPFTEGHKEDLRAACNADPSVWTDLYPYSMLGEHFDPMWARMKTDLAAGRSIHWAVMVDGKCVGITCYSSYDLPNATLEIGGTYYHPDYRGGATNPAAKRLIMGDAFASGARRVVFRVDAINARSRAAVTKLGAVEEGILRQDRVTWTGRIRDTVIFSVLNDEWPGVRDKLDARLASFA
jgi:RimJ/RimL family protein N-acetyltransferase